MSLFAVLTFSFITDDQPACAPRHGRLARRCEYDTVIGKMKVSSDQPALYMPIPAPARFTDLRQHLHNAQIDAAYLSLTLEQYLSLPENLPKQDWFIDPQDDHQAWQFRQNIVQFVEMIRDKPDVGNGEELDDDCVD